MNPVEQDKGMLITYWQKIFKSATDLDAWGQPVEAVLDYQKLTRALKKALDTDSAAGDDQHIFTDDEKRIIGKVLTCLEMRTRGLERPGSIHAISLIDLKHIQNDLPTLMGSRPNQFPVDVTAAQAYVYSQSNTSPLRPVSSPDVVDDDEDPANKKARGTLLPRPVPIDGRTIVTVRIEKIGLRDSAQYIEPHLVISVKDRMGVDLTPTQTTPLAAHKSDEFILFNTDVHVQRHLEALPEGFAILFDFRHYKPKKKQQSSKCWSFLERDELKEGPCCIEIYKKPLEPKRRRIRLLSSKPLFLHLRISLN